VGQWWIVEGGRNIEIFLIKESGACGVGREQECHIEVMGNFIEHANPWTGKAITNNHCVESTVGICPLSSDGIVPFDIDAFKPSGRSISNG
jgi:hypothetical protein